MDAKINKKISSKTNTPTLEELLENKNSILKEKENFLNLKNSFISEYAKFSKKKEESILNKIVVLKLVMCATFGGSSFGESLLSNPLFEKDELYEYKAKMLELIKQL